ncbi:DUF2061 domain-containing protein [Winogradskyella sp. R77965]|uniref:DUF2061 domain-containing protein n=1 Tax=Winogradskyella sp. R77965 TaxID=3093872 RepID=UPI0037DC4C49
MGNVIQTDLNLENVDQKSTETQENIKRSIVKTISWRAVGTLTTVTISYILTGTMALAFSIGGIELVSKMVLYFFHERTWNNIKWGK